MAMASAAAGLARDNGQIDQIVAEKIRKDVDQGRSTFGFSLKRTSCVHNVLYLWLKWGERLLNVKEFKTTFQSSTGVLFPLHMLLIYNMS